MGAVNLNYFYLGCVFISIAVLAFLGLIGLQRIVE
jgi:hypothetical protein